MKIRWTFESNLEYNHSSDKQINEIFTVLNAIFRAP